MKHAEDMRKITRSLGRYTKMRIKALNELRYQRARGKKPDPYVIWGEVRGKVMQMREQMGYDSDTEERDYRDSKGSRADYLGKQTRSK